MPALEHELGARLIVPTVEQKVLAGHLLDRRHAGHVARGLLDACICGDREGEESER